MMGNTYTNDNKDISINYAINTDNNNNDVTNTVIFIRMYNFELRLKADYNFYVRDQKCFIFLTSISFGIFQLFDKILTFFKAKNIN